MVGRILTHKEFEKEKNSPIPKHSNAKKQIAKQERESRKPFIQYVLYYPDVYGGVSELPYIVRIGEERHTLFIIEGVIKTCNEQIKNKLVEQGFIFINEKELVDE